MCHSEFEIPFGLEGLHKQLDPLNQILLIWNILAIG